MRIVFTGTSGIDRKYLLARLKSFIETDKGKRVQILDAEEKIRRLGDADYYEFLDGLPSSQSVSLWSKSITSAIREWENDNRDNGEPDFSFLSLHLVYHVRSHFYTPLNWSYRQDDLVGNAHFVNGELIELLRRFRPHLFLNLYDNVFSLQRRISDYPFRLIELLRWRNVESLLTDIVANQVIERDSSDPRNALSNIEKYKYELSPIVAIRHPLEMLYKLIADKPGKRIYMAYPISEPRAVFRSSGDSSLMDQVNLFRGHMRNHFIAFDPVTIDERPLKFLWEEFQQAQQASIQSEADITKLKEQALGFLKGESRLRLSEDALWPTTPQEYDDMFCGPRAAYLNNLKFPPGGSYTYELVGDEVRRAVEEKQIWAGAEKGGEVDNQIARRDYRLIDQVDCVVIYRPSLRRENWPEGGTRNEYRYARRARKPVLVVRDKSDGAFDNPPFATEVRPFDVLEGENLDSDRCALEGILQQACEKIESKIEQSLRATA